jgi:hypothetical protein
MQNALEVWCRCGSADAGAAAACIAHAVSTCCLHSAHLLCACTLRTCTCTVHVACWTLTELVQAALVSPDMLNTEESCSCHVCTGAPHSTYNCEEVNAVKEMRI